MNTESVNGKDREKGVELSSWYARKSRIDSKSG